jgi:hypothetical protein
MSFPFSAAQNHDPIIWKLREEVGEEVGKEIEKPH